MQGPRQVHLKHNTSQLQFGHLPATGRLRTGGASIHGHTSTLAVASALPSPAEAGASSTIWLPFSVSFPLPDLVRMDQCTEANAIQVRGCQWMRIWRKIEASTQVEPGNAGRFDVSGDRPPVLDAVPYSVTGY